VKNQYVFIVSSPLFSKREFKRLSWISSPKHFPHDYADFLPYGIFQNSFVGKT
jgi:hypothetical protein